MNKHLILIILLTTLFGLHIQAQEGNTYNFNRGVEEFENSNYESAMQLFLQELQRNEEDPGSWYYIAAILENSILPGRALNAINNSIKFTPSKEKEMLAKALSLRANLYDQLGDTVAELADLNQAVQLQPKDLLYLYNRGDYYYKHDDFARSDADFERMLKIDPKNAHAMIALSRNATERKQYAQAVDLCCRALEADPEMSTTAKLFRADAYMGMHDYDRATDDLIEVLAIFPNDALYRRVTALADSSFTTLFTRLKSKLDAEPENDNWIYAIGLTAISSGHYAEAIPLLATAAQGGDDADLNGMLARCFAGVGAYDQAIDVKRRSIERDSSNTMDYYGLAGILLNAGRFNEALTAINTYLEKEPDDGDGYSYRAAIHSYSDRPLEAIDDYTTAIVLLEPDGDSMEERYNRALLYQSQGNTKAARDDWQHIITSTTDTTSCLAALATMHLGNAEKAQQLMEAKLSSKESPAVRRNTLRCAAQLQALLGNYAQAIDLLRQAVECGHISPQWLRHNPDMASLQGMTDFEQIIERERTPQIELSTTK
ncbi:MAG: tetratricopeptide repeat protein [Muribaculaceae bacterium]|nr:tetratricopeptide repeat protein [Muribaculaceae bacterium]